MSPNQDIARIRQLLGESSSRIAVVYCADGTHPQIFVSTALAGVCDDLLGDVVDALRGDIHTHDVGDGDE